MVYSCIKFEISMLVIVFLWPFVDWRNNSIFQSKLLMVYFVQYKNNSIIKFIPGPSEMKLILCNIYSTVILCFKGIIYKSLLSYINPSTTTEQS